ncbi:ribose-phosphate diphosphokinase [Flavobacterium sp. Leaf359]|uniref:ribose-phosphate diphosphokinase n=1 Tax=Flavobacterium sp. Leaf359 TaxID=1736351 RepID=UPI0006F80479|nr:ribose-phosphate diphosphokinase [Flavobacterium sp. Leaf359]KQS52622.1 phosphoribosylpyrophosphate synthetase [Flavobacterium sp. Leaf359]PZQ88009.1 MAG: ribose-phosphate pyrophosphokinase [Flavobacterium johnsoniae]THD32943.1 MAG: ribose-phosphate pyrophosphokinase [Flavobacterium johnsoniae]
MILNLDTHFNPFPGKREIQFQSFTFSGGEPHIKINPDFDVSEPVTITHRINSFNDFGLLLLAIDALKRMDVKLINVFIPYFPAARQDRVMISGEPLSVKVYADILNSLKLNKVTVFDAHSEVTPALLDNCEVIPNHAFIAEVLEKIGKEVKLISPDGGALKKIYKVSEYLGGVEVVECSKSRDVKTGKLSGFKVYNDDLKGMDCLIVDDICDGGGTFVGLAEELKKKNAGKLYLAVSHGIFNKGFDVFQKDFEKIFTTNSFREFDNEMVEVVKLKL